MSLQGRPPGPSPQRRRGSASALGASEPRFPARRAAAWYRGAAAVVGAFIPYRRGLAQLPAAAGAGAELPRLAQAASTGGAGGDARDRDGPPDLAQVDDDPAGPDDADL